jgi:hypothetical protein
MINFKNKERVREVMDNALSSIQTLLSYLLLPIALPFVFFQECLAWFRERFGLNNRSMEGKVRRKKKNYYSNKSNLSFFLRLF